MALYLNKSLLHGHYVYLVFKQLRIVLHIRPGNHVVPHHAIISNRIIVKRRISIDCSLITKYAISTFIGIDLSFGDVVGGIRVLFFFGESPLTA
jgi:hypothetical protein